MNAGKTVLPLFVGTCFRRHFGFYLIQYSSKIEFTFDNYMSKCNHAWFEHIQFFWCITFLPREYHYHRRNKLPRCMLHMSVVTIYTFFKGVFKAAKVEEGGKTNDCYPTLPLYIRCNYYLWWYELFSPYTFVKIIFWIVWRREAK